MPEITADGPNAEQIKYWNERGQTWVQLQDMLDKQLQPLGERAMDRGGIGPGKRVLDIGCGCGATSIAIGERVGSSGSVVGIDLSAPMLQRARETAAARALTHVTFENADAQTHRFAPPPFDVMFSRFGVMFFVDPMAAFSNLRPHLRPGGKLAFVCWQALPENPWMFIPMMAAAQHVQLPPPPPPDAPGPFAFADNARVEGILSGAGFTDIGFESVKETLTIAAGASLDQSVDFMLQLGPTAQIMREAGPQAIEAVRGAIAAALQPYANPRGGIEMPGAAWVVTANG